MGKLLEWLGTTFCGKTSEFASGEFLVFDPASAPSNRKALCDWCISRQFEWDDARSYDDPNVTTEALRAWYVAMAAGYQVPYGPMVTMDSCRISETAIHASFPSWNYALGAVCGLAARHSVGFVVTSWPFQDVWLPNENQVNLTMQLRPKVIGASELLNAEPCQRGLNTFLVSPNDFDTRPASLRFEEYKEHLSLAWGPPTPASDNSLWWRSNDDSLKTMQLLIEDRTDENNTDILFVIHIS